MATEHNTILDPEIHEPKGIAAASAARVLVSDGAGSGAWTGILPNKPTSINVEADFPEQSGSTITLQSDVVYAISDSFPTAKRFIVENNATLIGFGPIGPTLTYTGTAVMFTGADANFDIFRVRISSPNATETFNFDDAASPNTKEFSIRSSTIISTPKLGTFNNLALVGWDTVGVKNLDDGITLSGTVGTIFALNKVNMVSTSATCKHVDLGSAIIPTIDFQDVIFSGPVGAVAITGLASSGNIPSGQIGTVVGCNFVGGLTAPFSGIDPQEDIRWRASGNSANVSDTNPSALTSLTGNAVATLMGVVSTPVKLAGATWVDERSSRFSISSVGTVTYNGESTLTIPVHIVVSAAPAAGNAKILKVFLAINGTVITPTGMGLLTDVGDNQIFKTLWEPMLSTGDTLEIFMSNETDTNSILATDALLMAR